MSFTSIWTILGIDQTDDLKAIKRAYAKKLKNTNPEDDANGFQELRGAYEQAVTRASSTGFSDQLLSDQTLSDWNARTDALAALDDDADDEASEIKEAEPVCQKLRREFEEGLDRDTERELADLLERILGSPKLNHLGFYLETERWLAEQLLAKKPIPSVLSDIAVSKFGWGQIRFDTLKRQGPTSLTSESFDKGSVQPQSESVQLGEPQHEGGPLSAEDHLQLLKEQFASELEGRAQPSEAELAAILQDPLQKNLEIFIETKQWVISLIERHSEHGPYLLEMASKHGAINKSKLPDALTPEALEHAQFMQLRTQFAQALRRGEDNLEKRLDAVLEHSSMDSVKAYIATENWMEGVIAANLEVADPIVHKVIDFFSWEEGFYDAPNSKRRDVLCHRQDNVFFDAINSREHPLYHAGQSLKKSPKFLITKILATVSGNGDKIAELLKVLKSKPAYRSTEFNPAAIMWWEEYLSKPRISLALFVFALLTLPHAVRSTQEAFELPFIPPSYVVFSCLYLLAVAAYPLLILHAKQWRIRRWPALGYENKLAKIAVVLTFATFGLAMLNIDSFILSIMILLGVVAVAASIEAADSDWNGTQGWGFLPLVVLAAIFPLIVKFFSIGQMMGAPDANVTMICILTIIIRVRGYELFTDFISSTSAHKLGGWIFPFGFVAILLVTYIASLPTENNWSSVSLFVGALMMAMVRWYFWQLSTSESIAANVAWYLSSFLQIGLLFAATLTTDDNSNSLTKSLEHFGHPTVASSETSYRLISDPRDFKKWLEVNRIGAVLDDNWLIGVRRARDNGVKTPKEESVEIPPKAEPTPVSKKAIFEEEVSKPVDVESSLEKVSAPPRLDPDVAKMLELSEKRKHLQLQEEFYNRLYRAQGPILRQFWYQVAVNARQVKGRYGDTACTRYLMGFDNLSAVNDEQVAQEFQEGLDAELRPLVLDVIFESKIKFAFHPNQDFSEVAELLSDRFTDLKAAMKSTRDSSATKSAEQNCDVRIAVLEWASTKGNEQGVVVLRALSK